MESRMKRESTRTYTTVVRQPITMDEFIAAQQSKSPSSWREEAVRDAFVQPLLHWWTDKDLAPVNLIDWLESTNLTNCRFQSVVWRERTKTLTNIFDAVVVRDQKVVTSNVHHLSVNINRRDRATVEVRTRDVVVRMDHTGYSIYTEEGELVDAFIRIIRNGRYEWHRWYHNLQIDKPIPSGTVPLMWEMSPWVAQPMARNDFRSGRPRRPEPHEAQWHVYCDLRSLILPEKDLREVLQFAEAEKLEQLKKLVPVDAIRRLSDRCRELHTGISRLFTLYRVSNINRGVIPLRFWPVYEKVYALAKDCTQNQRTFDERMNFVNEMIDLINSEFTMVEKMARSSES